MTSGSVSQLPWRRPSAHPRLLCPPHTSAPALGPEFVNLAWYFSFFQFMTPPRWALHWLCICPGLTGLLRLSALCLAPLNVLNNHFAATLSSARILDALHLLPLCSPPSARSHGLSFIPLAAPGCSPDCSPGCSWLISWLFVALSVISLCCLWLL